MRKKYLLTLTQIGRASMFYEAKHIRGKIFSQSSFMTDTVGCWYHRHFSILPCWNNLDWVLMCVTACLYLDQLLVATNVLPLKVSKLEGDQKNSCFWTVVLGKTLESPLDCKEIQPVSPKGNKSWIFIGRSDAEAETPILWPPVA